MKVVDFLKTIVIGIGFKSLKIDATNLAAQMFLKQQIQNRYRCFMIIYLLKSAVQANQLRGIKICHIIVSMEKIHDYWILLDEVNKENTLKLILGSHKWPKLIQPTKWSNDKPWYKNKNDFMEMGIETLNNKIMIPDLKLGDAVLFNFKIVHGASGNNTQIRRLLFQHVS